MIEAKDILAISLPPKCILSLGDLGPDSKRVVDAVRDELRKRMGDDAPVMIIAGAPVDQIEVLSRIRIPFDETRMSFRVEAEDEKQFLIIEPKKEAVAA